MVGSVLFPLEIKICPISVICSIGIHLRGI